MWWQTFKQKPRCCSLDSEHLAAKLHKTWSRDDGCFGFSRKTNELHGTLRNKPVSVLTQETSPQGQDPLPWWTGFGGTHGLIWTLSLQRSHPHGRKSEIRFPKVHITVLLQSRWTEPNVQKRQRGKSLHPITNSFSNHRGKGLFLIRYIIKIIFTLLFIVNIIITVTTVIC